MQAPGVNSILSEVKRVEGTLGKKKNLSIVFFDLVGSTSSKLELGHLKGTRQVLAHNLLCRKISQKMGGRVFKELGDGILVSFPDPIDACEAALKVKEGLRALGSAVGKTSITEGEIEELKIHSMVDVLGDAVDRCARIQGICQPGQILLDRSVRDAVRTHLLDRGDVFLSGAIYSRFKGMGEIDIYELALKSQGPIGFVGGEGVIRIHEEGRLSIPEKVAFMQGAKKEVIELGIGLTSFADYFTRRNPNEFKKPVADLLSRGVRFKCYALDPNWPPAKVYLKDRGESDYLKKITQSIAVLRSVQREFRRDRLSGTFEIYLYRHFPYFYAFCSDASDTKNGKIMISNYLFDVVRAQCPVIQFSRLSHPELFSTYWKSTQGQMKGSVSV